MASVSCGHFRQEDVVAADVDIPAMFAAVPSDALALVSGPEASQVVAYYDSTSALRNLDLGYLSDSRAVLSLSYYTSLVPVLTIDAGKASEDADLELQNVSERAGTSGFRTAVRVIDDGRRDIRVLIICPSETVLNTVLRHIDEGASIADVPLFREACAAAEGAPYRIIARPSAASRLLPSTFLSDVFPRRRMLNFAAGTASWLVLKGNAGRFSAVPVTDGSGRQFADFISSLEPSSCQIGRILPEGTQYVLDFPIASVETFRLAVEKYRDADISLERYRDTLKALRRACGEDPLVWEKRLKIMEVAAVRTDSASVLLLRLSRKPKISGIEENPRPRFIPALYGRAFDICDSHVAAYGKWMVFGSMQDVQQFVSTERRGLKTVGKCRMMCISPGCELICTDSGNTLEFK